MVGLKAFWNAFKTFAILFSFLVNFIVIIVLIIVMQNLFTIKNGIAQPLINGLHSSFVGLREARIITNITVEDTIPVKLDIPLNQNTVVTLTEDVPLRVPAAFTLADGTTLRGTVAITLPNQTRLPVALNLNVPVDSTMPVKLNVPVDISLKQTQLNDVANRLRLLFDPFVRVLGNLPGSWGEVPAFIGQVMSNNPPDLMADNKYITNPWPGFITGLGDGQLPAATPGDVTGSGLPIDPSQIQPTPTLSIPTVIPPEGGTTDGAPASVTAVPPTPVPTLSDDLGIITPTPNP